MTTPISISSRLRVLMFTDIVGSTQLKSTLGTPAYVALLHRHDALIKQAMTAEGGAILNDTGDGFLIGFDTSSAAVRCALRFQHEMATEASESAKMTVRIAIHAGEIAEFKVAETSPDSRLAGLAVDLASRLVSLAMGTQILLTRFPFNDARQFIERHPPISGADEPPRMKWIAHGPYLFNGIEEPVDVFEVGAETIAPLKVPPNSPGARRVVPHDLEETLGWRPAVGMEIPSRSGWVLERKLGEGGFGEVWLGRHRKLPDRRVFKFCFDPGRLPSFKREITLFRLLRGALGDRSDIVRLHEVKLDESPFYLESDYTEGGNLAEWAASKGGIDKVPLRTRLDIVARVADAVAAAHSVGVLHKDIKPSNILIYTDQQTGEPRPRLADFGIGMLADRSQLSKHSITETGFTAMTMENDSSRTGTRMYAPPESLTGQPFSVQGDIYAIGVLLYQIAIGDLNRPLGVGWERRVKDKQTLAIIATCTDLDLARRLLVSDSLSDFIRSVNATFTAALTRILPGVAAAIVIASTTCTLVVAAVLLPTVVAAALLSPVFALTKAADNLFFENANRLDWDDTHASSDITMVSVTDRSLAELSQHYGFGYPFPRKYWGLMAEYAAKAGAKAIVFDVLFSDASIYNRMLADDKQFARLIANCKNSSGCLVPIVVACNPDKNGKVTDTILCNTSNVRYGAANTFGSGAEEMNYALNVGDCNSLATAAVEAAGGSLSVRTGSIRLQVPSRNRAETGNTLFPAIPALGVLRLALEDDHDPKLESFLEMADKLGIALPDIPFKNKIVIFGIDAAGLSGRSSTYSWMELHATAIYDLENGRIVQVASTLLASVLTLVFAAFVAVGMIFTRSAVFRVVIIVLTIAGVLSLSACLFNVNKVLWAPSVPLLATFFSMLFSIVAGRFVPPTLAERIARSLKGHQTSNG